MIGAVNIYHCYAVCIQNTVNEQECARLFQLSSMWAYIIVYKHSDSPRIRCESRKKDMTNPVLPKFQVFYIGEMCLLNECDTCG